MRTSIFQNYADLPEELLNNLQILWTLSKDQWEKLIPGTLNVIRTETYIEEEIARAELVSAIEGDKAMLLKSINILEFLYQAWNPITDTAEGFIEDLSTLNILPKSEEEGSQFLLKFFSYVSSDNRKRIHKAVSRALIPNLRSLSIVVDVRPVFDTQYGSPGNLSLEEYEPKFIGWSPILVVKIKNDASDHNEILFQASESALNRLINQLNAGLIELDETKSSLPSEEVLDDGE